MYWKLKSCIQNVVSLLPSTLSYKTYYWIQRHFGNLRSVSPVNQLTAGIQTWKFIKTQNRDPTGKIFLEIGTGRAPFVPLSYWLMGAKKTITIDLHPYLKTELICEGLRYISDNRNKIKDIYGPLLNEKRFDELLSLKFNGHLNRYAFLNLCSIKYIAPGDAADTDLSPQSIDFHTSYNVLEHIQLEILKNILKEGNRIIDDKGLFVHRIDYSDHFSHSDENISTINFLKYSNKQWNRYAGNRYMYMNRLRHDDYLNLFNSLEHQILETELEINQRSLNLLKTGELKVYERFNNKTDEILSIESSWIISEKVDEV